ncbi:HU family DNA-binding protein [bacterium]|nr:HU family DNA-binding protein [bacterium]
MTKAEIINRVAQTTGMSRKDAIEALEIFLSSIKEGLKSGEKISLVGFGTFYVKHKKARNGRNPRTGDRIHIPPKLIATFKPGKSFRQLINDGEDYGGGDAIEGEEENESDEQE